MSVYAFLERFLPRVVADWLVASWYAILVVLVLYCAFEPHAEFNYLTL
jgi:hypothetical protein